VARRIQGVLRLGLVLAGLSVLTGGCSAMAPEEEEAEITPQGEGGLPADEDVLPEAEASEPGESPAAPGPAAKDLGTIYFPFDSSVLTANSSRTLRENAKWLKENPGVSVQIEGHCDERGTTEYNLGLGERRANAARKALAKAGVDAKRISIISWGEERPAEMGHNEGAWAKNRRAEFVTTAAVP